MPVIIRIMHSLIWTISLTQFSPLNRECLINQQISINLTSLLSNYTSFAAAILEREKKI